MNVEKDQKLCLDWLKLSKVMQASVAVLPVVVQDVITKEVLILAYMSEQALQKTCETGELVLYSTSRDELWFKGSESGNVFGINEIRVNCEQNSLLILVTSNGSHACHVKDENGNYRKSCYYRSFRGNQLIFY